MWRMLLAVLLPLLLAGCHPSSPDQGPIMSEDRTGWKKLSKGMTPEKVRTLLGEPLRVDTQGEVLGWYYREGQPLERDATNAHKCRASRPVSEGVIVKRPARWPPAPSSN
jgi:outer membrane protein assembly factor BamE (lipoprotein component of BamABCDE complex)